MQNSGSSHGRILALDLLRFAAVVLVIGRHLHFSADAPVVLKGLYRGGWVGVDLFFVLSGFLVAGLLFREYKRTQAIDVKRFLIRRGLKIYPAFYFFLACTVAFMWFENGRPSFRALAGEVFFFQNYVGRIWNHTWSLAVEEHFYLLIVVLLGALVSWRGKAGISMVPTLLITLSAVLLIGRFLNASSLPYSHGTHLFPSHLRLDSLGFGVLLAYAWNFHESVTVRYATSWRLVLLPLGVMLLLPAFRWRLEATPAIYTVGLTCFYVGSGCILLAMMTIRIPPNRLILLAGWIGAQSYSIYLWHMPVVKWIIPGIESYYAMGAMELMLAAVIASISVGVLAATVIELPVLMLRDRIFPSKSGTLSTRTPTGTVEEAGLSPASSG